MPRVDMIALLEAEFKQERTDALGRIGRKLQAALDEVKSLDERLEHLLPGPTRQAVLERHREARRQAEEFRFFLVVQRESLGLMEHSILDEAYPVPRVIKS